MPSWKTLSRRAPTILSGRAVVPGLYAPDKVSAVADALSEKYRLLSAQEEMVRRLLPPHLEDEVKNMQKMLEMFEDNDDVRMSGITGRRIKRGRCPQLFVGSALRQE